MLMSGKRSTDSRRSETTPSTVSISDSIRMRTGLRSASRVSHMTTAYFVCGAASQLPRRGRGGAVLPPRELLPGVRVDVARHPHLAAVGEPLAAGGHHLVARLEAARHLEPGAAVDAGLHVAPPHRLTLD